MKKWLAAVVITASCTGVPAHGPEQPQHGGVVQAAGDLSFELVAEGRNAALYVSDHGRAADASRLSGKLTVLQGGVKSEAPLKPAGGNKLEASAVTLGAGAKAVATLATPDGKTLAVRFALP